MERLILKKLLNWKNSPYRKPLILKGVRQVGKTWILKEFGRPLINTEWMHRPYRSIIQTHLPLWKKEKIGSYFFGFVNGKSQFNYVWEFIKKLPDIDTRLWMHDIFHSDFTPYDKDEIAVLKACNENKKIWEQKQ